jgi:preprotein translocase subunit SecA
MRNGWVRIHRFLGMSVGVVVPQMEHAEKQASYQADITYGTNNEFGFDYLRDNMATSVGERFQRGLHYAIVDEVDSILIDEARTPLIISGQAEDSTELYRRINVLVPRLVPQKDEKGEGDYWVDLKMHTVTLSEAGHEHGEELMTEAGLLQPGASLYDPSNIILMHHLYAGIRAHALYHRDQHYVGDERRDRDRRRIHRPHDAGPALVRRPAPGGGGQGKRHDQEREPDARLDHVPELLPLYKKLAG